jgi:hypothetical protein
MPDDKVDRPELKQDEPAAGNAPRAFAFDVRFVKGLAGSLAGAAAGYILFHLAYRQAILLFPLPGACAGLGRILVTRHRSFVLASVCAVIGFAIGLYTAQEILAGGIDGMYTMSWSLVTLGGILAFWIAIGDYRR